MGNILSKKTGFIDYKNGIFENDVQIYMILGQRSDGKTYGILQDSIAEYVNTGIPSAYIRRFDESLKSTTPIRDLCKPQSKNIAKLTQNAWTGSKYIGRRFYFAAENNNDKIVTDEKSFLQCYALNTWENSKGADSGKFHNIIFDEFVSASKYLPNEYTIFENILSSILRNRNKSRLIMLGNPINQICPYFDEFDLPVHKLKPGDIVYRISQNGVKMKFVYVPPIDEKFRKTAGIFDFKKNSSINTGYWEFGEFPHLPDTDLLKSELLTEFAFLFRNQLAICRILYYNGIIFAYWDGLEDDEIMNDGEIMLFSDIHIFQSNVFTAFQRNRVTKLYLDCVQNNRQYFADNKTGNLVKMWYREFVISGGRFV